jgi:hypothetical protein
VKSGQIGTAEVANSRRKALKGADIAGNSLGGVDIAESTLGEVPSAEQAGNAQTLDNLDSNAFARAEAAPQVRRLVVADPNPGDEFYGAQLLLRDGPWTLRGRCAENRSGLDETEITLSGPSGFSLTGLLTNSGVIPNSSQFVLDGEIPVAQFDRPTGSFGTGFGTFTAVAPDGEVLSGFGSAEINDTQAGNACTFGATTIR